MDASFGPTDALILFGALPFWLLVGHLLLHATPNLPRYGWGAFGGMSAGLGLMAWHGLWAYLWIPILGAGTGVGAMMMIYLADGLRGIWRYHRGGGAVFAPQFLEFLARTRRAGH